MALEGAHIALGRGCFRVVSQCTYRQNAMAASMLGGCFRVSSTQAERSCNGWATPSGVGGSIFFTGCFVISSERSRAAGRTLQQRRFLSVLTDVIEKQGMLLHHGKPGRPSSATAELAPSWESLVSCRAGRLQCNYAGNRIMSSVALHRDPVRGL